MTKNLMPEVLKMLGVEYGEKFKLCEHGEELRDGFYYFVEDMGLRHLNLDGKEYHAHEMLEELLTGYYEIVKVKSPWEPKKGDSYFFPSLPKNCVVKLIWTDNTYDYALKALGMVYRTREEAQEHFAEDYERLTGKKLEVDNG